MKKFVTEILRRQKSSASPLFKACEAGDIKKARKLLAQKDTDVNLGGILGMTPLMQACIKGNLDLVMLLLEHKANIEQHGDYAFTSLMIASLNGHTKIVELLIKQGAKVNGILKDRSALVWACDKGQIESVKILIKNKAGINQGVNTNDSALYVTCSKGYLEIVSLLIENGADLRSLPSNIPLEVKLLVERYQNGLNPYEISLLKVNEAKAKLTEYFDLFKGRANAEKTAMVSFIRFAHNNNERTLRDILIDLFGRQYPDNSELPQEILFLYEKQKREIGVFFSETYAKDKIIINSSELSVNSTMVSARQGDSNGFSSFLGYNRSFL